MCVCMCVCVAFVGGALVAVNGVSKSSPVRTTFNWERDPGKFHESRKSLEVESKYDLGLRNLQKSSPKTIWNGIES